MEKRTLIALALSFLVLGCYPLVLQKFYPEYYKQSAASKAKGQTQKSAGPASASKTFLKTGAFVPAEDVIFKNQKLDLVFNKKDGGIREIAFPAYIDSESRAPLKLLSLKDTGVSPGAVVLLSGGDLLTVAEYETTRNGDETIFTATSMSGKMKVEKRFTFGPDYAGRLNIRFENLSNAPVEFQYELLAGSGITPRHSIDSQYIEANFYSAHDEKKVLKHIKENRAGKRVDSEGPVQWVAIKDRHFCVVIKPGSQDSFTGVVHGLGNRDLSASLLSPKVVLPPGGSVSGEFVLYVGPNELEPLMASGLEELVNFGKFDLIGKFFVGALELLHNIFRNYGIAIIVLTALINLLLFPLTRVSYMSMKRMQLVQPQMTKLREQHKKNPEKLNKEMMELYKKHKVNPFGGCMPMVVQIPIFIALYVALSKSVILINSKLMWIQDLSSPDKVYLPVSLPFLGNSLHVLPLLMVCAMAAQQRFTQIKMEGQDPAMAQQQKMMAVTMPIVFGFVFYQMPSGLVLYWLTNTVLMSLYQLKLKKMTLV